MNPEYILLLCLTLFCGLLSCALPRQPGLLDYILNYLNVVLTEIEIQHRLSKKPTTPDQRQG